MLLMIVVMSIIVTRTVIGIIAVGCGVIIFLWEEEIGEYKKLTL